MTTPTPLTTGHAAVYPRAMIPVPPDCGAPCAMCEALAHINAKHVEERKIERDAFQLLRTQRGELERELEELREERAQILCKLSLATERLRLFEGQNNDLREQLRQERRAR